MFTIPVCLILFRRRDAFSRIIARLREVQPGRIYLLGDAGRNEKEQKEVEECRAFVEKLIDWPCEIIKHYADSNRGVYQNIGEGAKWVFEREEKAIFIEDDNLPEVTFFRYAEELLEKYADAQNIGWICGTNYFQEISSQYSYQFTQHLLPCGWASWSKKFLKLYDGEFELYRKSVFRKAFRDSYQNKLLWLYQKQCINNELYRKHNGKRFISWDYQMVWSIRAQKMYGIIPMRNQIMNIGVDDFSIHGGNTKDNVMTDRFCEVPSLPLEFPLVHPEKICIDKECEREIGAVILPPLAVTIKSILSSKLKIFLRKDLSLSWRRIIKGKE